MNQKKTNDKKDTEWDKRVLCVDESCIGVIGPDGLCKECGLPHDGEWTPTEAQPADLETDADTPDADPEEHPDTALSEDTEAPDFEPVDENWDSRTLCGDESCIGVIGSDGRCKECGKPYPD